MITDCLGISKATILLTGGRAAVTLDLARLFHRAGHRVLVAESRHYHLCRVSRSVDRCFAVPSPNKQTKAFIEAIESIAAKERVDVLIPTCEEIFFIAMGLDRLSRYCTVWSSPLERLRKLHNKWTFHLLAQRCGLAAPHTELIRSRDAWLALGSEERRDDSIVLKPVYSRFASRVIFLDRELPLDIRRRKLAETVSGISEQTPWVAQQRVYGRDVCTYSVAFGGKLLAHAAYPVKYKIGSGACVYFEPLDHAPAFDWVSRFVKAIGFTGQIAFDFIEDENGVLFPLECNPRATSGVHLFSAADRLERAFLEPGSLREEGIVITPQPASRTMLAAAMIAAGMKNFRYPGAWADWWKAFRSGRDVVYRPDDPRPFAEQFRVLLAECRNSKALGIPLVEAATSDIEWNGET